MKLFVGLGNPDKKYEQTRHNLGQMVITKFTEENNLHFKNYPKLSAQIAEFKCRNRPVCLFNNDKVFFAITTEYMNNSGLAVKKIINYFKIKPEDIYIIHDDLDIPIGEYKIQFDRGAAGHNGIISIIEHLGTQAFNRIRIGIGKPENNIPIENYVLQPFSLVEKPIIQKTISEIISTVL